MATEKRLIDANAAIKEMNAVDIHFWDDAEDGVEKCVNILHNAPTVDAVEVVHGRWKYGTRSAVCSECGFERHLDDNFGAAIACPNCCAKMDGDRDG